MQAEKKPAKKVAVKKAGGAAKPKRQLSKAETYKVRPAQAVVQTPLWARGDISGRVLPALAVALTGHACTAEAGLQPTLLTYCYHTPASGPGRSSLARVRQGWLVQNLLCG